MTAQQYWNVITSSSAPGAPPTAFHVVVLNSSAIELQWNLPLDKFRNGVIRGFKLFIQQQSTTVDNVINVDDNSTTEYIVSGLTANTAYICSMLAYTNADGPRTIQLTVITMASGEFGVAYSDITKFVYTHNYFYAIIANYINY